MTVTVDSFRKDLPEFVSIVAYPSAVIKYWIAIAQLLMGTGSGSPPQVCSFTGTLAAGILTVDAIEFGSLTLFPLLLQGGSVPESVAITQQLSGTQGGLGTYAIVGTEEDVGPEQMVALQTGGGVAGNPFWGPSSLTADSPPTTVADFATEMFVAHQIVLEKQALAAAATGGDPGTKIGIINNKSVNGASIGFDVATVAGGKMQENAGYYNQTIYGMRFYRLMKIRGSGPIQIGVGRAPPFLIFNNFGLLGASNAWGGPFPGIEPGDTGFGS